LGGGAFALATPLLLRGQDTSTYVQLSGAVQLGLSLAGGFAKAMLLVAIAKLARGPDADEKRL